MKARTLISIAMCAPICALTLCADPVWRYWAAGDDGAKLNDAKAWNPNGVPGAEDTLGVTIGTNKPARVEAGDDLTVNNLYVGWGRKYNADGTHISDDAANDLGGRLDVSGGILNVLSSLTVGGGWADNNDAVMNVAGGRVNAASLFTGDCGSWSGKKDTINISGSGTVFAVGGGDVRFSNFSGGTTFVNITDGAKFTKETGNKVYVGIGKATLNVNSASVEINCQETWIGVDGSGVGTINLTNADWHSGTLHVGRGTGGTGVVDISGGTTVLTNNEWYGTLNLGWEASSGTMYVRDNADVTVYGWTGFGRSPGSHGIFEMSSGSFTKEELLAIRNNGGVTPTAKPTGSPDYSGADLSKLLKKKDNSEPVLANLKELNLKAGKTRILRSFLLGFILFVFAYLCACFIDVFFETRFLHVDGSYERMAAWNFGRMFRYFILYVPFCLVISTLNNMVTVKGVSDSADTAINVLVTSLGMIIFMVIGFAVTYSTPGHAEIFRIHAMLSMIFIVPVTNYMYRKMYKLTGSVWAGAVLVALFVAWRAAGYLCQRFMWYGNNEIGAFWGLYF